MQAGTFHNFTVPDQLPVARISLFGANRTCAMGRSSPICEPRLEIFYKTTLSTKSELTLVATHLDLVEHLFTDVDNPAQVHSAVETLLSDTFLSSVEENEQDTIVSTFSV